ncbi:AraC family transcriptional regulator [Paenibacillus chondroitinus]|uniref:AraC family transcriptional regulator n=1 Tax=Paenibacillus chondroitinus TaxID=59842 RepID=A0ABU6D719_9BACL|nr:MULTISPECIES: AraC family transcriptional regulator [Paenibacillus]MCY9657883.1 AraC family transcriptional regulator [Paenibacillus anseongense]MEB4793527.1 AraC family transcriptional regulator [Paenibacillus chondroitinus]
MKITKKLGSKKYLARIYLWFASLILLVTAILSSVVYYNVQEKVFDNEYKNSRKLLAQTKYNMEYLDNMVRNLILSTYNNNDVRALMYLNDNETFDYMNVINKLKSAVVWSNSFVQSVYIYNNNKQNYYSTYGQFIHKDIELEKLLQAHGGSIQPLKPIVRNMDVSLDASHVQMEKVLTYVMYELTDEQGRMDGAVILNIKLEWLFNNIKAINNVEMEQLSKMFILSDDQQFMEVNEALSEEGTKLAALLQEKYPTLRATENYFSIKLDGNKYLAAYITVDHTGWILFKTVPYDEAYVYLNKLRTSIIIITVIVLLATLLVLYQVSRGIYRPVEQLVAQLRSSHFLGEEAAVSKDEFIFLQDVYKNSAAQLGQFHQEKISGQQRMKNRFLSKWILNSLSVSIADFEASCLEHKLPFRQEHNFMICVLKFDNYKHVTEKSFEEKELLVFAVMNIASEFLSQACHAEAVDLRNDHVAVILQSETSLDHLEPLILQLLKECQTYLFQCYNLSITAALSASVGDHTYATTAYQQALNVSMYRFIAGKMSVLTQGFIKQLGQIPSMDRVLELENQLLEQVRNGNYRGSADKLAALLDEVKKLEYSDMTLSLLHAVNQFKYLVYDLNKSRKEPVKVNTILMSKELLQIETIGEFQAKWMEVIEEITSDTEVERERISEDVVIALRIQEMIDERYADLNLGASEIATVIGISPAKVGKIFKAHKQMSIPDYMNRVRLERAVEWMENSQLNIQDIMRKVGFENESYFYKVFKAKFGTTPREFMAKRIKERM